jgi:uncharacterized protein (TIGR02266 family)
VDIERNKMLRELSRQNPKNIAEAKMLRDIEHTAFFQISSAFSAHKDLKTILEVIVRESLNCLKADRSTIYLMHEKSGILKIQCTHASDPIHKEVDLKEEGEIAQKTLRQNKPFLLRRPKDFSDFFKYNERERKITSLMTIPFLSSGKTAGVLSAVMINEKYGFDEKRLEFFSSFANFASTAMGMAELHEEVNKGKSFRTNYERYLDDILNQLQGLSQREGERIESHILKLQAEPEIDERKFLEDRAQEKVAWVQGTIILKEEAGIDRRKDERVETRVRVEFEEEYWGFTKNLSRGGAFILTPDPLELGDEFLLKLFMPDGGEPIESTCKVIWTNKYGKETKDLRQSMGIKFLRLQPEAQKRIEEHIKSHKK